MLCWVAQLALTIKLQQGVSDVLLLGMSAGQARFEDYFCCALVSPCQRILQVRLWVCLRKPCDMISGLIGWPSAAVVGPGQLDACVSSQFGGSFAP
jgi:hypothetical protein